MKTSAAPTAVLVGQICDGIATPIVGYFSDRTKTKYGIFISCQLGIIDCCMLEISIEIEKIDLIVKEI